MTVSDPTSPTVLALRNSFVEGWPEHDDERAGVFPLSEVLTGRYDSDLHFTAYTAAVERRHTGASIASLARADEACVQMVAAVFDVDGKNHRATDEWWDGELVKLKPFVETGAFIYRTRNGYRIVYELEEPVPIRTEANAAAWTCRYVAWCNYLKREHGIVADTKCKDWQHLFRAPHATREAVLLELPTYGCSSDIGVWNWDERSDEEYGERPELSADAGAPADKPQPSAQPSLTLSARRAAAAKMLGAAWPAEGRHGAQLALAGGLCYDGWSESAALEFLCAVCHETGNEERPKREKTIRATYKAKAEGRPYQGWTSLEGHVDKILLDSARKAIDLNADGRREFESVVGGKTKDTGAAPSEPVATRIDPATRARRLGGKDVTRLKTGIHSIDISTRGGLLARKLCVVGGAPGAGKTALLCKLAYEWLTQGVPVGFLASDEDADGLLIRIGQLHGLSRDDLEGGNPTARDALARWCESVPFILADGDEDGATIESVSQALRDVAAGGQSVLLVDSIQTARTGNELPKGADIRTRINEAVRVLKRAAKADGHLVWASSELARAAYRNKAQADNVNALSAFKESGDIEYGVSFAVVLVSSPGTNDLVNAEVVKNRLGAGKPAFVLKLDHARADVTETAREEQILRDPLTFVKGEVIAALQEHRALTPNRIYAILGGRKTVVLSAIKELLEAKRVIQATEGIRFPLPGEGGYGE